MRKGNHWTTLIPERREENQTSAGSEGRPGGGGGGGQEGVGGNQRALWAVGTVAKFACSAKFFE